MKEIWIMIALSLDPSDPFGPNGAMAAQGGTQYSTITECRSSIKHSSFGVSEGGKEIIVRCFNICTAQYIPACWK